MDVIAIVALSIAILALLKPPPPPPPPPRSYSKDIERLENRITDLENRIRSGAFDDHAW